MGLMEREKSPESPQQSREEALQALSRRLGYRFKNPALLDQALRHSSYTHERPESGPSNEQMEFLGDAVLTLTVSHLLIKTFPESSEGELSRRRAALVNARQLAELARRLNLGSSLLLGRGERRQAGHEKPSLLADALEAVLAAVFLDGGLRAAQRLVHRWFTPFLSEDQDLMWGDPKTTLQELIQSQYKSPPTYRVVEERGPSHARSFVVELRLGDVLLARGEGPTKKQAEQQAALAALKQWRAEEKQGGGKPV